ncbi:BnaC04g32500D [Brassica napus]|uniref:Uncharacterized protein n=2 Tax=Brassica TaxID=3705 RepID=A0A3P6BZU6_BRAOL|nr:unnamed protein product [Brassica napus]CDY50115.1 BnaC04g32500D [Brassica napus]VDD11777.1 unnamed protein product [Brassica oleracea]
MASTLDFLFAFKDNNSIEFTYLSAQLFAKVSHYLRETEARVNSGVKRKGIWKMGRWPVKFAQFGVYLLKNAEVKVLDVDALFKSHIHMNQVA